MIRRGHERAAASAASPFAVGVDHCPGDKADEQRGDGEQQEVGDQLQSAGQVGRLFCWGRRRLPLVDQPALDVRRLLVAVDRSGLRDQD